jgi:hypothetical protein
MTQRKKALEINGSWTSLGFQTAILERAMGIEPTGKVLPEL